jgi:hypothetical protein
VLVLLALVQSACRPDDPTAENEAGNGSAAKRPVELLDFPEALRVADPAVNAFVTEAMASCASGDYDAFRRLWSAREDPLPRHEYEEAWRAVERIRIRALEEVILAPEPTRGRDDFEPAYIILADVSLDPNVPAGQREPKREVVLQLVREQDMWRLARAPKAMRTWVRTYVKDSQIEPVGSTHEAQEGAAKTTPPEPSPEGGAGR